MQELACCWRYDHTSLKLAQKLPQIRRQILRGLKWPHFAHEFKKKSDNPLDILKERGYPSSIFASFLHIATPQQRTLKAESDPLDCYHPVASLGLVSLEAATDGVTLFFLEKIKVMTFLSVVSSPLPSSHVVYPVFFVNSATKIILFGCHPSMV